MTIVSDMTVVGAEHNTGTFDRIGRGPICESGDVADTRLVLLRGSFDTEYVLTVNKTFICADGSGTFFARLLARGNASYETFTWVILGGTGQYRGLFGLGSGSTVPIDGGVTNTYTGYIFP